MNNRVSTIDQLEALYPGAAKVVPAAILKETPVINDAYRALIEATPFFTIASVGKEGLDCSPRGDGPGSLRILDERTIAFPDRRGNNRLDTLRNIVEDPRVGLLAIIPGLNETLRINGRAYLTADPELLASFAVGEKVPASVVVIEIDTMYFQCARAVKRAKLWDAEAQLDRKTLPSAGQLVRSVIENFDANEYDSALQERQAKTLY